MVVDFGDDDAFGQGRGDVPGDLDGRRFPGFSFDGLAVRKGDGDGFLGLL